LQTSVPQKLQEGGTAKNCRSFADEHFKISCTMSKFLSLFFLLTALSFAYTQTAAPAREAADRLIQKYGLDTDQADKIYTIQVRKQRNLAEIETLKTTDPVLFHAKLESIQQGTQAGIRRLLTTKKQRDLFQQTQSEQRRLRGEKRREMEEKGAAAADTKAAILDIYLE
jgi:hypothetical protein